MLAVRLDPELEARLTLVAARTGRSKSYYARQAIENMIEDMEDIAAAEEALRAYDPTKNITLEALRVELGLDD